MPKDNIDPRKYGGMYEYGEIEHIIQLSARLKSPSEIQRKFAEFSPGKPLSGKIIKEIQMDNLERIAREAEMYAKFVEGSPFSHPRLVLDMWMELLESCKTERPTVFDRETNTWHTEPDNANAIKALEKATLYLLNKEKIDLEKLKVAKTKLPAYQEVKQSDETTTEENESNSWVIE